jgi:hypothetical protein
MLDIRKSPFLIQLLKSIVANMVALSSQDMALHQIVREIKHFLFRPDAVDPSQITSVLNRAKDIASSYPMEPTKKTSLGLPQMFYHAMAELEHLTLSQNLSNPKTAQTVSSIDRLTKHIKHPFYPRQGS